MKYPSSNLLITTAVASLAAFASATIPEGDISPYIQGGQLKTALVSEDGLTSIPDVRVFYATLGEDVPNFAAEPGWQAADGTFAPNSAFTFQINRALRKWNGTDFSTLSGTMQLSFGPLTPTVTPAFDSIVQGFNLPIDEEGGLHDHPDYQLLAPADSGIYLLDLSFSLPGQNLGPSLPLWILFGQDAGEQEAQAAFDFASATIPTPAAALLLVAAPLAVRRRRAPAVK